MSHLRIDALSLAWQHCAGQAGSQHRTVCCHTPQGANQAVAVARLSSSSSDSSTGSARVAFICRFGNDSYADMLRQELAGAGVDVSGCGTVHHLGSGQGIVMLEPDGAASSIVVGGANLAWGEVREEEDQREAAQQQARSLKGAPCVGCAGSAECLCVSTTAQDKGVARCCLSHNINTLLMLDTSPTLCAWLPLLCLVDGVCVQGAPLRPAVLAGVGVLMLQREVPEAVNLAAAQAAAAAGIPVMLVSCRFCWWGAQSDGRLQSALELAQEQSTPFSS